MTKRDWIEFIIIALVIILVRTFIITISRVSGQSMENTLFNGNLILVNKIDYKLNKADRFEVVTIKLNREIKEIDGEKIIKRVIGLPGEEIEYKDNKLYINGEVVETPIEFQQTDDFGPIEVGSDEYFVMGDNRGHSFDSRKLGPVKESEINGVVHYVLFPFKNFGKIK